MSYIDLATLALHRRNEMEARIKSFVSKCDRAIQDIVKLKIETQGFVNQLNCDPAELKERFLNCMKTLDEYMYLITDFNLTIGKLEELKSSIDYTPVQDVSSKAILTPTPAFNIMDMLTEPTPSTSTACPNFCPLEHKPKRKISKEEQTLILFSSTSCSSESMPMKSEMEKKEKEVQCKLPEEMKKISITDPIAGNSSPPLPSELYNLPAQTVLQTDHVYPATVMNIDGASLWVITDNTEAACKLMTDMTSYYKKNHTELSLEEMTSLTYCAYYDEESDCYYRGLFIRLTKDDVNIAEVFLVDTGEVRCGDARSTLQPLAARFCTQPPYARCCHLAGVDMLCCHNKELAEKQEQFLRQYVGMRCNIEVDDNTSESLGVFVKLSENETLNELLIKHDLACFTSEKANSIAAPPTTTTGPPELGRALSDSQFDITGPEYDDPLEAVTGYSNRDEADICKHYKGGPEKTCFKGLRCKKRHVLMHPDGWTLDKVEVVGKCLSVPLPAPGTWLRALVTFVAHFDHLFVQIVNEEPEDDDPLPDFGVILPPTNLDALVRDMNSPATRTAYKPLTIMPAPGELVAALYPPDDQWYRARVLSVTRADQNVEVTYIDYGNVVWVKEDAVRALEPRFTALPAQAVRCVLAGVAARGDDSRLWAAAKQHLTQLTQDRTFDVHVIARGYDEITVEMFNEQGYNVAEQLAADDMVVLKEYSVVEDSNQTPQIVVP